ncbi:UDP-glucose 4-epimerase [Reichenbachiella sp. 5M10]|uniref:NAD-dependent epimerase/dehydratase family protein n=1 Tax=Reichenbachiella sp. 5M10 TaxID=1889772 RepID=UPI000C155622|nr:NAD-dependent epimerase/dehydratase family protein [Reichenbachiella sp. 5M10]PIB36535.1 UDP-glucose 4-epimerase [Reichenbachiella sp. 5M10]
MPKSLVTGGAGFIGSHVSRELLQMGHQVVVLDDLSGGFRSNVPHEAIFVKGSILDVELLQELFVENQFDYVYHLAAYAAEGLSHFIKRFNYQNNLIGSVNLLNESIRHEVKCFVFTSSIAVYGGQVPPMTEEMIPQPEDPYGIAKYAFEQELKVSQEMFGMPYVIFRPHNVYGENQNLSDPYRNVLGIFVKQLMTGEKLTVYGDGSQSRAFSYIDDVAPWIARSVVQPETYGQVYNIGSDTPCTVSELAQKLAEAFGLEPEITYLPARSEVAHAYCSHGKLKRVFTPTEEVSLDDGIGRMVAWAKNVALKPVQKFDAIELDKNLPPNWLDA